MSQLPVTVLSGFLGAGKTSLVRHLLAQPHGRRIAVLVNDLAAVNIDGPLVTGFGPGSGPGPAALVELSNGCICCTLRDDLVAEVARLAAAGRFDYLLIEPTGISEPLPVAEAFTFSDGAGRQLLESAMPDTLVTVVDARGFLDDLPSVERLRERGLAANGDDDRHLAELLVEQVELANVLLVNKTDLVSSAELQALVGLLQQLNPTAEVLFSQYGRVPSERVMGTGRFSFDGLPGWLARLHGAQAPDTTSAQVTSFVYKARRPFHPARLWELLRRGPARGLLRSKGFVWLATRPDVAGLWSQAGRLFSLEPAGAWWASAPEAERPPVVPDDWHPEYGDRRQELVFIGQGLDGVALSAALSACLLTDGEMEAGPGPWQALPDPLPAWDLEAALAHQRPLQPALS